METKKKILFFLMGRSGSGKDTVMKRLLNDNSFLKPIIPFTTRAMRTGEMDGVEYHFVNEEEFKNISDNNTFMDRKFYRVFHDENSSSMISYGYPEPTEDISIISGPYHVCMNIQTNYSLRNRIKIVPIYIRVMEENELLYRMILRESKNENPNYKEVARRFCADQRDFPNDNMISIFIGHKNVVYNSDLEKCLISINDIIKKTLKEENYDV